MNHIHPSALIHPGARLGEGVVVGPYAVIEEDTVIGDGCSIGAHAVIKRYSRMGGGNRVYEHAIIGGDPQDIKFRPCASYVEIGNNNLIREGVTIHRGSTEGAATVIGHGNFLMAYSHVAHDCRLDSHVVLANGTLLGGFVTVAERAFVSGAVTVHQFCRVGTLSMVGASARINQDCLPFVITDGAPGRARALNVVGLKRAGVTAEDIRELRHAFRLLLHAGLPLHEALAQLDASGSPAVAELRRFIRTSGRGFAHAR